MTPGRTHMHRRAHRTLRRAQSGFGAIVVIVVLVILAALAAAIVSLGNTQQITSAQDVQSAKAWHAARTGNEWGLYQTFKGAWTNCSGTSQTLDLGADTGFRVTVYCDSTQYNEGESSPGTVRTVRIYTIRSVACPASTCPASDASVAGLGYLERTRVVVATQ